MSTHDLITRAKEQALAPEELDAVADRIRAGAKDQELYDLLYILGRSFSYKHEKLIAEYLNYPEYPFVARQSLQVLCRFWDRQGSYLPELRAFIRGVDWDEQDLIRLIAIPAAGEYLTDHSDPELLQLVYDEAFSRDEEDDDIVRQAALGALATGAGWPRGTRIDQERLLLETRERIERERSVGTGG